MTDASSQEYPNEFDRRKNERWDLFAPCQLVWQEKTYNGRILDLSQNGAMVESSTLPPHGQQVTIFFSLEGMDAQIGGTVIHRHEAESEPQTAFEGMYGFYVEFLESQKEIMAKMQNLHSPYIPGRSGQPRARVGSRMDPKHLLEKLSEVNKEIWLVLSLIVISVLLNFLLASNQMVLGFYTIPTVFSAYFFGRRHATLTAFASIFLVLLVAYFKPLHFEEHAYLQVSMHRWLEVVVWGGILIVTGYAMGTLYERNERNFVELRQTYRGVLTILQQFIAKDKYTQNHSYRVSVYATDIARQMGLDRKSIEDIRDAALIHDIGKLDVGREILYKASRLNDDEFQKMRTHIDSGVTMLEPVRGSLRRILPIILAHHDRFDGSGYHPIHGEDIPLGARIIAVADAYDSMVSDRPYRKGMSPMDAKEAIVAGQGQEFDPDVVKAFLALFRRGKMDVPDIMV